MSGRKKPTPASVDTAPALPDPKSDEWVEVIPEQGLRRETARALLAAARDLGYDEQRAVRTVEGGYRVPQQVLDAANLTDAHS